jgi:hypothetical protein
MPLPNRYACTGCGTTTAVIHRTSPKGERFAGKCASCLGGRSAATMAGKLDEALTPDAWLESSDADAT